MKNEKKFINLKSATNLKPIKINRNPLEILLKIKGKEYLKYRNEWKSASDMKLETDFPIHVDIDITGGCNRKCDMCLQWKNPGFTNKKVSINLLDRILSEVKRNGGKSINLGVNTEPTLYRPLFLETMLLMKKYDFIDSFIHTNGLTMNEEMAESILNAKINNLSISLSMLDNRKFTDKTISSVILLKNLMKKKKSELPIIRVSMIPTGENIKETKRVVKILNNVPDYIEFQDLADCNDIVKTMSLMEHVPVRCIDPWRRFYINAYGDMYGCAAFPAVSKHLFLGNYEKIGNNNPIKTVWSSEKMKIVRQKIKNLQIQECNDCMNLYYKFQGKKT